MKSYNVTIYQKRLTGKDKKIGEIKKNKLNNELKIIKVVGAIEKKQELKPKIVCCNNCKECTIRKECEEDLIEYWNGTKGGMINFANDK